MRSLLCLIIFLIEAYSCTEEISESSKNGLESSKKIMECLKASRAIQKDPTSVEIGTQFISSCEMFIQRIDLSEAQKSILRKFGFKGSHAVKKPERSENQKTSQSKEVPSSQRHRENALSENNKLHTVLQQHTREDKRDVHPPAANQNVPDTNVYLKQQQFGNPFGEIPKFQPEINPFHHKEQFGQLPFNPDTSRQALGENVLPHMAYQPVINPQFIPNFDHAAHQDFAGFHNFHLQNMDGRANAFQPNPQFGTPYPVPFVPFDAAIQSQAFGDNPPVHPNADNTYRTSEVPGQDIHARPDHFQRYPNRFDEL